MAFSHSDQSILARWWYTVDRRILFGVLGLILIGLLMVLSAGPYAARRIGADGYLFFNGFIRYLFPGVFIMLSLSFLSKKNLIRLGFIGGAGLFIMLLALPFVGITIKGATRWISLGFMNLQPSEIYKPLFIIMTAFALDHIRKTFATGDKKKAYRMVAGYLASLGASLAVLAIQPDLGMAMTIFVVWSVQTFVAGLPKKYIVGLAGFGVIMLVGMYFGYGHFRDRLDRFLFPSQSDTYQIDKAVEAIKNGGWLPNPGDGYIKEYLPDSHTDFVFAVLIEEFGALIALLVLSIYFYIILRTLRLLREQSSDFIAIAGTGLITLFTFQTLFNIASTIKLVPTKGMTLPFISYGGSSFLCFAVAFGILLGLLRSAKEKGELR